MSHLKLHVTLHTWQSSHFTLRSSHCTLKTPHFTLHTPHITLHTSHVTLHSSHSKLHTSQSTLHTSQSTLHTSHFSLLSSHSKLHTSHFTLHSSPPTLHTVTLHTSSHLSPSHLIQCHMSSKLSWISSQYYYKGTCMRSAPARPVHACFVRSCCNVVVQDNSITHAAAAPSNLDAATTMRSADTELQNTIELRATVSEIAPPKPDLDAKAEKRRFWSTF